MKQSFRTPALPPPPPCAPVAPTPDRVRPRVSLVLPTYGRAQQLGPTLATLLAQSFVDFELLVCDDGQGAESAESVVREAAAHDARVRYLGSTSRLRMPNNLNRGISASSGELVATCHDHDLFAPRWLETLVGLLDQHPSAWYAHCGISLIDAAGRSTGERLVGTWPSVMPGRAFREALLAQRDFFVPISGLVLMRREAYERFGLYRPVLGLSSDVEMWMRLADHGDVAYAPGPLVEARMRDEAHDEEVDPWPRLLALISTHRMYLRRELSIVRAGERLAFEGRADGLVLRQLVWQLRRGKGAHLGQSEQILRESAGPLGRVIGKLFP